MDKFSKWLIDEMKQRDWSQSELARASGLTRQVISYYLVGGSKSPNPDALRAIASAFHISPETVFRAAGILPSQPAADEMVEKLNYKINQLTPGARKLADKFLDMLLEEDQQKVPVGKTAKNTR